VSKKREMTKQQAVDKNYTAFKKLLPSILPKHANKYALMRDGEIVEFFDTARDALITGNKLYEDDLFSVQRVTDTVEDLGYYSHAVY